jgi:hypothetical protein
MSRDSSFCIANGWMSGFDSRLGVRNFSPIYIVRTGSGARPGSYRIASGVLSPGVKQLGCEADPSPPTNAEVKSDGAIT